MLSPRQEAQGSELGQYAAVGVPGFRGKDRLV